MDNLKPSLKAKLVLRHIESIECTPTIRISMLVGLVKNMLDDLEAYEVAQIPDSRPCSSLRPEGN